MKIKDEVLLKEEKVYEGVIVDAYLQEYQNLGFKAEVIKHPGAVVIAATHDNENFYVVDQYRFPTQQVMVELPAGKIDKGEDPLSAAVRELEEEIGYQAHTLLPLGHIYSSPGFTDEKLYLYYATNLTKTQQNLDPDEVLEVRTMTLSDITDAIMDGSMTNAISIATTFKLKEFLKK